MNNPSGVQTSYVITTNWQAALNNNSVQFLNFKTISLLSSIEVLHQTLRKREDGLLQMVYSPALFKRSEEGLAYKQSLAIWIADYQANENQLLGLYQEFTGLVTTRQYKR